jgi:hypothetical protein
MLPIEGTETLASSPFCGQLSGAQIAPFHQLFLFEKQGIFLNSEREGRPPSGPTTDGSARRLTSKNSPWLLVWGAATAFTVLQSEMKDGPPSHSPAPGGALSLLSKILKVIGRALTMSATAGH